MSDDEQLFELKIELAAGNFRRVVTIRGPRGELKSVNPDTPLGFTRYRTISDDEYVEFRTDAIISREVNAVPPTEKKPEPGEEL